MINEILPLKDVFQVKRNKSRIDKWQEPMRQTLNCKHHELIHRWVIGLHKMQKNVVGFYALLLCTYSKEMAGLHGCHSNVNSYLKYISNAGRNCIIEALSSSILCKQVLPLPLHFGSFRKLCGRKVSSSLSSAYSLPLFASQLFNTPFNL